MLNKNETPRPSAHGITETIKAKPKVSEAEFLFLSPVAPMAAQPRIIALNLGMQTITLAEFRANSRGGLMLSAFRREELMVDPAADATRPAQIEAAVGELRKALRVAAKERATSACLRNRCSPAS